MESDETYVCPNCDSPTMHHRTSGDSFSFHTAETDDEWYCKSCECYTDSPNTRERHSSGLTGSGVLERIGYGELADSE